MPLSALFWRLVISLVGMVPDFDRVRFGNVSPLTHKFLLHKRMFKDLRPPKGIMRIHVLSFLNDEIDRIEGRVGDGHASGP